MQTMTRGLKDLGSVILNEVIRLIRDERGEVAPGDEGDDAQDSGQPAADTNPSDGGGDDAADWTSDAGDAQEPEPTAQDQPGQKPPAAQEGPEGDQQAKDDLAQRLAQLEADLQTARQQSEFYQRLVNERAQGQQFQQPGQFPPGVTPPGQQQQPQGAQQQQPPQALGPPEPPPDLVGPEEWENQSDQAKWVEHTAKREAYEQASKIVAANMQTAYQQAILPTLQSMGEAIMQLQVAAAKAQHPDYDDVMKAVSKEIFELGPNDQVFGVKNQALLKYFQSQQNPYLAMYEHGARKTAPAKIKKTIQDQTGKLVSKLATRPKAPVTPKSSDSGDAGAELDWTTPAAEAEKILHKKKLI